MLYRTCAPDQSVRHYFVLALAAVFEGGSLVLGWRAFSAQRGDAEDSAALAGLTIATAGIDFSHRLDMPQLDGVASILIGVLLAGVAILLIQQSRRLLVGKGVSPEAADAVRRLMRDEPGGRDRGPVLSMYIGPEEVLGRQASVVFVGGTPAEAIAATIARMQAPHSPRSSRRILYLH
ncbi:MAG: hypothetical protein NVS2B4_06400 [Ramlibacter sp.]